MSFDTAASLGCRFIRSYCALVHQGAVKADDSVEIYGCVGVGRSAIMIAKAYRAKVIGLDINDNVSSLAKSIGADF